MKVRLIHTLPIEAKHGAIAGREFTVAWTTERATAFSMIGDAGEEFTAFSHEVEITEAEPAAPVKAATVAAVPAGEVATAPVEPATDAEKIEAANKAISYFLDRMRGHEKLLYHMAHTRSLELLCDAYAKLNGVTADRADDFFCGRTDEL